MRVKLDENIPAAVFETLRAAGHDVATALEEGLGGKADPIVIDAANANLARSSLSIPASAISERTHQPTSRESLFCGRRRKPFLTS